LSQEGVGVSVASQYRFLELAAIETKDSLLGLHVAAEMDVRDIGILFYLRLCRRRSRMRLNTWLVISVQQMKPSSSRSREAQPKQS
jgi:hypothetical protein